MFEVVAGRYVLIDSIGSGGVGEVWRAFDRKTGAYCAAKVIRNPEAVTLVRVVFEQAVRLEHPHVVTPYAWVADDEQVLLAMPLVRGGSLAVLLRDLGVLPPRYSAEVLRQLLVALEHVHGAGLVHRDVKPANLLLESTGTGAPHARLADFGLVLTPDRPRITGTFKVVGTRAYLAPESLERGDQGIAQDLYAAGLVGLEMVGSEAVAAGGPLVEVLAALTAPEPARRPGSATEALERLAQILDGWPLETPAPIPGSEEPVEVFEQIGPLPAGWGPAGPIAEAQTVTTASIGEDAAAATMLIDLGATMRIERRPASRVEQEAALQAEPAAAVRVDPEGTVSVEPRAALRAEFESTARLEPAAASPAEPQAPVRFDPETTVWIKPATAVPVEPKTPLRFDPEVTVRIEPEAPSRFDPGTTVRVDWPVGGVDRLWSPGAATAPSPGPVGSPDYGQPRIPLPGAESVRRPPPRMPATDNAFGVRYPRSASGASPAPEPSIDRVRLISVNATAPPVSRRRWRTATVFAVVIAVAGAIGLVVTAWH